MDCVGDDVLKIHGLDVVGGYWREHGCGDGVRIEKLRNSKRL